MPAIPEHLVGPLAGVGTSALWVFTTIFFTAGGRRIGPTAVNTVRISLAVVFLGVTHRVLTGHWIPEISTQQAIDLGLSGILGLSLCDQALFMAFMDIGPRRSVLVMTTSPIFALVFGLMFLGEAATTLTLVGMAATLGGVVWVLRERTGDRDGAATDGRLGRGIALATFAAAMQAAGAMLSKRGMGHGTLPVEEHLDPQAATFVRMAFGAAGVLPIAAYAWVRARRARHAREGTQPWTGVEGPRAGRPRSVAAAPLRWRSGLAFTAAGAVFGPYLGVWLSLIAFDRSPIGIAQTLCSLTPVMILPLVPLVERERVTGRAVVGALIAVGGSALLFVA